MMDRVNSLPRVQIRGVLKEQGSLVAGFFSRCSLSTRIYLAPYLYFRLLIASNEPAENSRFISNSGCDCSDNVSHSQPRYIAV